jgi:hypothetical protein
MIALATTVADSGGHLIPKLQQHLSALVTRFDHLAVAATTRTPAETVELLRSHGAVLALNEPDSCQIGRHRRQALAMAAEHGAHVMYLDLDHALRWVESEPSSTTSSRGRSTRSVWSSGGRRPGGTRCRDACTTPRQSSTTSTR